MNDQKSYSIAFYSVYKCHHNNTSIKLTFNTAIIGNIKCHLDI